MQIYVHNIMCNVHLMTLLYTQCTHFQVLSFYAPPNQMRHYQLISSIHDVIGRPVNLYVLKICTTPISTAQKCKIMATSIKIKSAQEKMRKNVWMPHVFFCFLNFFLFSTYFPFLYLLAFCFFISSSFVLISLLFLISFFRIHGFLFLYIQDR